MARSSAERLEDKTAFVTDYNSDDDEELPATRKQANISVKRSSDLEREEAEDTVSAMMSPLSKINTDLQSDSGYSSHTHLTSASADTCFSVKSPLEPRESVTDTSKTTTDSTLMDEPLRRSASRTKDKKHRTVCTDPNCKERHSRSSTKTTSRPPPARTDPRPSLSSSRRNTSPRAPERSSREIRRDEQADFRPGMPSRSATTPMPRPPPAGYGPHPRTHPPPHWPPPASDPRLQHPGYSPYPTHDPYAPPPHRGLRPPFMHHTTDIYARQHQYGAYPYAEPMHHPMARGPPPPYGARRPRSPWHDVPREDDLMFEREHALNVLRQQAQERERLEHQERVEHDEQRRQKAERRRLLVQYEERQRQAAALEAARLESIRQETARNAMPPPMRPASAMNRSNSMRKGGPAIITYATSPTVPAEFERLLERTQFRATGSIRAPSPTGTAVPEVPRSKTPGARRNSAMLSTEGDRLEIEIQKQALLIKAEDLEKERLAFRRQQERDQRNRRRESADAAKIEADLRPRMRRMSLGRDEHAIETAQVNAAQQYISQISGSSATPIPGILKNADRKAAPSERSKRSARSGRASVDKSRRRSLMDNASDYQGSFKTTVDTRHEHEFEIGDTRLEIRPGGSGRVEVVINGKTEKRYYASTKASSSTGSKLGRRTSHREPPASQDFDNGGESTERERLPARRDNGKAPLRRRAETFAGPVEPRRPSRPPVRQEERSSRGRVRVPASPGVAFDESHDDVDDDTSSNEDAEYSSQDERDISRRRAAPLNRHSTGRAHLRQSCGGTSSSTSRGY